MTQFNFLVNYFLIIIIIMKNHAFFFFFNGKSMGTENVWFPTYFKISSVTLSQQGWVTDDKIFISGWIVPFILFCIFLSLLHKRFLHKRLFYDFHISIAVAFTELPTSAGGTSWLSVIDFSVSLPWAHPASIQLISTLEMSHTQTWFT